MNILFIIYVIVAVALIPQGVVWLVHVFSWDDEIKNYDWGFGVVLGTIAFMVWPIIAALYLIYKVARWLYERQYA